MPKRPPPPVPYAIPGDRFHTTINGVPATLEVTSVDRDPDTGEWVRYHLKTPEGYGHYVRTAEQMRAMERAAHR